MDIIRGHWELNFASIFEPKPVPRPPNLNLEIKNHRILVRNNIEIWGKGGFLRGQADVRGLLPPTEPVHWVQSATFLRKDRFQTCVFGPSGMAKERICACLALLAWEKVNLRTSGPSGMGKEKIWGSGTAEGGSLGTQQDINFRCPVVSYSALTRSWGHNRASTLLCPQERTAGQKV